MYMNSPTSSVTSTVFSSPFCFGRINLVMVKADESAVNSPPITPHDSMPRLVLLCTDFRVQLPESHDGGRQEKAREAHETH
jgi:hypothetical protein